MRPVHHDASVAHRESEMTSSPASRDGQHPRTSDFSVVLGGPLFQLLRRAHLADDALQLVRKRVIVLSLFAWLPLLLLSVLEGHVPAGSVPVPFLRDIEVHIRFLVAMPLLIGAEFLVHSRMRPLARQFQERRLVSDSDIPRFDAAVASAARLRNSWIVELTLLALVYGVGVLFVWRHHVALDAATWYGTPTSTGRFHLSLAGRWFAYVSMPVFQFLLIRWYLRVFIWARFLWQVSRIQLHLVPTHPDRVGGLGFLGILTSAFVPLALAHGALLAGLIADRILFAKAGLLDFKGEIAVVVVFMLLLALGPLLLFAAQLAEVKRTGLREYGTLAQRYVRDFDGKWLRGGAPADEPLVGSADIQSLADLGTGFDVVGTMSYAPITKDAVIQIVGATLAPIAPLVLTMMPLEQLVKTLARVLF
jgi:hypothetical protein